MADYFGQMLKLIQGRQKADAAEASAAAKLMAVPELQNSHGGSMASGMVESLRNAVNLPAEVYRGEVDPRSEAGIGRAADMAGTIGLSARGVMAAAPGAAPEGAIGMFAGRNAATADHVKLSMAQDLANGGWTPREIWDKTGWFKGADDRWRFEIDDSNRVLSVDVDADQTGRLADMMRHKPVYDAYPDAAEVSTTVGPYTGGGTRGYHHPGDPLYEVPEHIVARGEWSEDAKSTLLHELQHAIQKREGFAVGGDPAALAKKLPDEQAVNDAKVLQAIMLRGTPPENAAAEFLNMLGRDAHPEGRVLAFQSKPGDLEAMDPKVAYRRLAGEVEARNVQARRDMTMDERRALPPWETEDVPRAQQVVRRY